MQQQDLIGRSAEIETLQEALSSKRAELVALYGRRRVGKTFLVRTVYEKNIVFEMTGLKGTNLSGQLENFRDTLSDTIKPLVPLARPATWMQAFRQLAQFIEADNRAVKKAVFLDEFPWMDTPKSGFLQAFDHFWNSWASRRNDLVVVICGSAASWMIKNIVRNRGGLHNRLTRRIRLQPFNLHETECLLKLQNIALERHQILELYMAMGGIPQYLMEVKPGESPAQTIDRLCFTNEGWLRHEFMDLYPALFDNAQKHLSVVRALAEKPYGMSRNELMASVGLPTGGSLSNVLDELLQSGFISDYVPFGKTTRDIIYKLSDEYSLFYLKFIENSKSMGGNTWLAKSATPSYTAWSGIAFENICLKHVLQIKKALGIAAVYTEHSIWRTHPGAEDGAQIDLLFDRNDKCINLIEIKFSGKEFIVDKKLADELRRKRWAFMEKTQTKKSVFTTLMTTFGAKTNEHFLASVQNQIQMDALFKPL